MPTAPLRARCSKRSTECRRCHSGAQVHLGNNMAHGDIEDAPDGQDAEDAHGRGAEGSLPAACEDRACEATAIRPNSVDPLADLPRPESPSKLRAGRVGASAPRELDGTRDIDSGLCHYQRMHMPWFIWAAVVAAVVIAIGVVAIGQVMREQHFSSLERLAWVAGILLYRSSASSAGSSSDANVRRNFANGSRSQIVVESTTALFD